MDNKTKHESESNRDEFIRFLNEHPELLNEIHRILLEMTKQNRKEQEPKA